jgi:glycosyltransferase involved in cell wall biosynthesis
MKILVFNKYCPKHMLAGGAEMRLSETMERIARKGHEIHLVSALFPGAKKEEFFSGMHVHRIGLKNSDNTVLVHILGALKVREFAFRINPDVILEDISPLPWFSPISASKPKLIIIHHINGGVFFQSQNLIAASVAWILERSIGLFYRKERIIAISASAKKQIERIGIQANRISVIKDGVDSRKYRPCIKNKAKKPTILFLGRLEKRKGADLLINAFHLVKKIVPEAECIIAGTGKEENHLRKMAAGTQGIFFAGKVEGKKKLAILNSAWIFAAPSRTEGYSLAVLEANACGVPAVANSCPGLSDSVIHNKTGLVADAEDKKAFAGAICSLLIDSKKRTALAKNAVAWAKMHSWDKCAEETLEALESECKK